jgi:hypothetical protein
MTRRAYYRLHKWVAIGAGAFLLNWIVSGIVMILPHGPPAGRSPAPADYRDVVISPSQAAASGGDLARDIALARVGDSIVYRVQTRRGVRLVDARSGAPFEIGPDLARILVRSQYSGASDMSVERLERHAHGYGGPLPAYRLREPGSWTQYFVALQDGSVQRLTAVQRLRNAVGGLHTFTLPGLDGWSKVRRVSLFAAAMAALAAALTGYYLALPKR